MLLARNSDVYTLLNVELTIFAAGCKICRAQGVKSLAVAFDYTSQQAVQDLVVGIRPLWLSIHRRSSASFSEAVGHSCRYFCLLQYTIVPLH